MRTILKAILLISLVIILLSTSVPVVAQNTDTEQEVFATDHILVKFKPGVSTMTAQSMCSLEGDSIIDQIDALGVQVVKIPDGRVQETLETYLNNSAVEYAEPDYFLEAVDIPDDPGFTEQWGLEKIQAPPAWDITEGNPDVIIAILDSGIDLDHEDLASKIVASRNFTDETTVDDIHYHGTAVAGVAAAITDNGIGVAGVAGNASLMNVKVLKNTGSGSMTWAIDGIIWATDNGAKVINMSLGSQFSALSMQQAVDYAWSKGVIVVAAAGNDSSSSPFYPAAYDHCIAVAATNQNDVLADFSNFGNWVDVVAPGVSIHTTAPNHLSSAMPGYITHSGTSFATPFVAGLAALVWSTPYGTSNASVRSRIENTADPIPDTGNYWRCGRINAQHAVGTGVPRVSTGQASDITPESAVLHGNLVSMDSANSVRVSFEYGDSESGYSNSTESITMTHTGEFHFAVNGLSPDKVYYFRATALGNYSSYGNQEELSTWTIQPEGKIAFITTRYGENDEIHIMDADGNHRNYVGVDGSYPGLSTDSRKIAYSAPLSSDTQPQIFTIGIDGKANLQLTDNPEGCSRPAWSPDGTKIAFQLGNNDNSQIYVMNSDGTDLTHLITSNFSDMKPDWSPDGRYIVFESLRNNDVDIYVANSDGSNVRKLTHNTGKDCSPSWSPDGARIAFTSDIEYSTDIREEIWTMDKDGGNLKRLVSSASYNAGAPDWSPAGNQIVFSMEYPDENGVKREISIINTDGSGLRRLTNDPSLDNDHPVWALNSTKPVARDDSYNANAGATMVIGGTGVCVNDDNCWIGNLTSLLVSDVKHGTLYLASTGNFNYTSLDSYSGTDSFTYKANDGRYDSNIATVTITVKQNKLAIISQPQSIVAGAVSGAIWVQRQNNSGESIDLDCDTDLTISTNSSAGRFDIDPAGLFENNEIRTVIPPGKTYVSVYYRSTQIGPNTIIASSPGYENGSQQINVIAGTFPQIRVETLPDGRGGVVPSQNLTAGNSLTVYAVVRDEHGNFVANGSGEWSLANISGVSENDLVPSQNKQSAIFTGHKAGSARIRVTSANRTSVDSGLLSVVAGSGASYIASGFPSSVFENATVQFTLTAIDQYGNTVNDYSRTVHFSSSDSQAVLPADYTFTGADRGAHTFQATFRTPGTQLITATEVGKPAVAWTQNDILVQPEPITLPTVVTLSASNVTSNSVQLNGRLDSLGSAEDGVAIYFEYWYGSNPNISTASSTITSIPNSGAVFNAQVSGLTPGQLYHYQAVAEGDGDIQRGVTVDFTASIASNSELAFTTDPWSIVAGSVSGNITVQTQNSSGSPVNVSTDTVISLASNSTQGSFDTSAAGAFDGTIKKVTIPAGHNQASFYYKDTRAGSATITASSIGYTGISQTVTVSAGAATQVRVETKPDGSGMVVPAQTIYCIVNRQSITVYGVTRDQYGNYVGNSADTKWSLKAISGKVAATDLGATSGPGVVFTGHKAGTAIIHAEINGLTSVDSGTITIKTVISGNSGGGGGGGGGNPPAPAIQTTGLNAVTPISLNTDGTAKAAAQYKTGDGKLTLDIAAGTKLTSSAGATLTTLSATVLANPPAAPEGNAILLAYEFGPEGAAFNPALTLTFSYVVLPEGAKDLSLMYWNGTAWESVQAIVDTANGTITAQISHFSKYALVYQLPAPANLAFTGITISPENVKPDEKVTIQAAVTNSGDLSGSYTLTLKVNGRQVEVKEVTVAGGQTETVSFEVQRGMEGEYSVEVNGQKGKFTVGTAAPAPSGNIAEVASPTPIPAQTTAPALTEKTTSTTPAVAAPANPSLSLAETSPASQNEEKPTSPVWWIVIGVVVVIALLVGLMIVLNKRKQQIN